MIKEADGTNNGIIRTHIWRHTNLAFLFVLIGCLIIFNDALLSLINTWLRSGTFQHGLLIIPIVFYLIWMKRQELACFTPVRNKAGLIAIGACSLIWFLGDLASIEVLRHFSILALFPSLIFSFYGYQIARSLAFPLAYTFFALPVGESLVGPLQDITANLSVNLLQLTGIPVFTEGRYISIPNGNFVVAEACSGIRFFIASAALGTLYAYLVYTSFWKRAIFILISLVIPVFANAVRVYGIIIIAHLSDMRYATGADHLIYGWQFFGLVILLMFWIGWRWHDPDIRNGGSAEKLENLEQHNGVIPAITFVMLVVSVIAIGPVWSYKIDRDINGAPTQLALLPPSINGSWREGNEGTNGLGSYFKGADAYLDKTYKNGGQDLYMYIALYSGRNKEGELVNSSNRIFDTAIWKRIKEQVLEFETAGTEVQSISEIHLRTSSSNRLAWTWYQVGNYTTIDKKMVKLYEAWFRLTGQAVPSAVIIISTPFDPLEKEQARKLMKSYLKDMGDNIAEMIGKVAPDNSGANIFKHSR